MAGRRARPRRGIRGQGAFLRWTGLVAIGCAAGLFGLSVLLRHWDPVPVGHPQDDRPHIRVEVLNGCGVIGLASVVAEVLKEEGIDVVSVGNAPSFDHERTVVIDRAGRSDRARAVAEALGAPEVTTAIDSLRAVEVSVIVGSDYHLARGG